MIEPTERATETASDAGTYAARAFAIALRAVVWSGSSGGDREAAAQVVNVTARHVVFTERVTTDVLTALAPRLSEPSIVQALVNAIRRCRDAARVGRGLGQLAIRAHREGHDASLIVLVAAMQSHRAWRKELHGEWLVHGIQRAISTDRVGVALRLFDPLDGQDRVPEYLLEVFERDPQLLAWPQLRSSFGWWIHRSHPTPEGWRILAETRSTRDGLPSPASFGSELTTAIETLEVALGREADHATRAILGGWLVELAGGEVDG